MIKKIFTIITILSFLTIKSQAQTVLDIDGNSYNTVTIGTQIWMKENLKTTRFNNGDLIPTTSLPVYNDTSAIYQWMYNEDPLNVSIYGRLYTWYVVNDDRNVCPAGWHVPNDIEFTQLADFLSGDSIAGDKMKEVGTSHWSTTNILVTNASNFTALPGGIRGNPSGFSNISTTGCFWTSTPLGSNTFQRARYYRLKSNSSALEQAIAVANCGLSLRCLKNISSNIGDLLPEDQIQIFPNPVKSVLNISFALEGSYNILLYDYAGKIIIQKCTTDKMNAIDVSSLSTGLYIAKIEFNGFSIERIIIIK